MELLEDGHKLVDEAGAPLADTLRLGCHHLLYQHKKLGIGLTLGTQHCVALLQGAVICYERSKILSVVLRYYNVHKAPSLLAATGNKFIVGRRDHHKRNCANVVGETLVVLFIPLKLLLLTTFETAGKFVVHTAVARIIALNHKERLTVCNIRTIDRAYCTLAEREIIDGIEQIGFPHSVATYKTIYLARKSKRDIGQIPIIEYRYIIEQHITKSYRQQSSQKNCHKT